MQKSVYFFLIVLLSINGFSQVKYEDLTEKQKSCYDEHVFGGQPDNNTVLVRVAYLNTPLV